MGVFIFGIVLPLGWRRVDACWEEAEEVAKEGGGATDHHTTTREGGVVRCHLVHEGGRSPKEGCLFSLLLILLERLRIDRDKKEDFIRILCVVVVDTEEVAVEEEGAHRIDEPNRREFTGWHMERSVLFVLCVFVSPLDLVACMFGCVQTEVRPHRRLLHPLFVMEMAGTYAFEKKREREGRRGTAVTTSTRVILSSPQKIGKKKYGSNTWN